MKERLNALRGYMEKCKVAACVIPTSDAHMSEYLCDCFKTREYFCPFTGSAGTLVVTKSKSALWTDGRYYLQAEEELAGTETVLVKSGEKGSVRVEEFLSHELRNGQCAALDGRMFSFNGIKKMRKHLSEHGILLKCDFDPSRAANNVPLMPKGKAYAQSDELSGESVKEKITRIRQRLKEKGGTYYLTGLTDCICWALNLRADDVKYTPVMLAFLMISESEVRLFTDREKTANVKAHIEENSIIVEDYDDIYNAVRETEENETVVCDFDMTNVLLVQAAGSRAVHCTDIVSELKAVKNETEINNIKKAYIAENVALIKTFYRLYNSTEIKTEYDVSEEIEKNRKMSGEYLYPSFETIAAFGKNAAMLHYAPKKESSAKLKKNGLLLIDTGGQYFGGTTDTTRTLVFGRITREQARHYTLVLKANIALSNALFPSGCAGRDIDSLARAVLWKEGLDYRCGTGHGVGYMLCVHEGPQRISPKGEYPLCENMTVTNEPGYYKDGEYGIRTETHMRVIKKKETEYGTFFGFENLGFCPIGTNGILKHILTKEEKEYINAYNGSCVMLYKEFLSAEEYKWLKKYTKKLR